MDGVDPISPEAYRPPIDLRPAVLRDQTLERCAVTVGGEIVTYTVVATESEALPEGVDEGYVEPGEQEDNAHRELVVRKKPVADAGKNGDEVIAFMGDGQRMTTSTETGRVRDFIKAQQTEAQDIPEAA